MLNKCCHEKIILTDSSNYWF